MTTYYENELVTIYHGDCLEILPELPKVDLVLTDPPYGIDYKTPLPNNTDWGYIANDTGDFDLSFLFGIDAEKIIFGANNFPHLLPHRGRWICWYKRGVGAEKALGSAFELAWTSKISGFERLYHIVHGGFINADGGKRFHPTQKPVKLFLSILSDWGETNIILDPFLGSGTTAVAAMLLNRKCIGIEIEEKYCEIAAKRCEQARTGLTPAEQDAGQLTLFEK